MAEAVEEIAGDIIDGERRKSEAAADQDEEDRVEVRHIKHEILDESGRRIGQTTTSKVQAVEEKKPDTTPKRTFKDVMSQAMKQKKSATPSKRSRSPTPFDNVPGSTEKAGPVRRTPSGPAGITPDLMNPHHYRAPQVGNFVLLSTPLFRWSGSTRSARPSCAGTRPFWATTPARRWRRSRARPT